MKTITSLVLKGISKIDTSELNVSFSEAECQAMLSISDTSLQTLRLYINDTALYAALHNFKDDAENVVATIIMEDVALTTKITVQLEISNISIQTANMNGNNFAIANIHVKQFHALTSYNTNPAALQLLNNPMMIVSSNEYAYKRLLTFVAES